jgi:hypothetical protein
VAVKKLTPGEIKIVVDKIRRKYDEYIGKYFKPKFLREAFEDRYLKALKSKVDISSFLLAEISAVEELIRREEERVAAAAPAAREEPKKDTADKVIEANKKLIAKYPDLPLHKDSNPELRKLTGALNLLEQRHWPALSGALRNTAYSMNSAEMLTLESRLRYICSEEDEEAPPFLIRYVSQLNKFPRNYPLLERQEKEYILEAAFFLNDLLMVLERIKKVYHDLSDEDSGILDGVIAYVGGVISDFRLKEFKKKKEWDRDEEEYPRGP